MLFFPRGFANGVCTLTDNCQVLYHMDNYYDDAMKGGLQWNDPDLGIFAKAALTARSWYEADASAVDAILNNAITNFLSGKVNSAQALRQAEDQVSQLMRDK